MTGTNLKSTCGSFHAWHQPRWKQCGHVSSACGPKPCCLLAEAWPSQRDSLMPKSSGSNIATRQPPCLLLSDHQRESSGQLSQASSRAFYDQTLDASITVWPPEMADPRTVSCFCFPQCTLACGWLRTNISVTLCLADLRMKAFLSGNVACLRFFPLGDCPYCSPTALKAVFSSWLGYPKEGEYKVGV